MFWAEKRKLVARGLPEKVKDCSGNKWQLADLCYSGVADAVSAFLEKQKTTADIQILKEEQNRLILRVGKSPNANSDTIIAKVFPLYNLRLQLKCYKLSYSNNRFGFGEAHNLLYARDRGFWVPSVLGYGRINGFPGVVKYSIVLLEDFGDLKTFYELFKIYRHDQDRCLALLNSMNDSFLKFYETGCSMVNFHTKDVVSDGQRPLLYDFEYGIFRGKPNIKVLLFELAQFSKVSREFLDLKILYQWVKTVNNQVGKGRMNEKEALETFDYFFNTRLSRKDRLNIN